MNETKFDRRAHWVQWVATGIVVATAWCVRLEFTVSSLKTDMEYQKRIRDDSVARLWDKIGSDHDMVVRHETEIQWLKNKGR